MWYFPISWWMSIFPAFPRIPTLPSHTIGISHLFSWRNSPFSFKNALNPKQNSCLFLADQLPVRHIRLVCQHTRIQVNFGVVRVAHGHHASASVMTLISVLCDPGVECGHPLTLLMLGVIQGCLWMTSAHPAALLSLSVSCGARAIVWNP